MKRPVINNLRRRIQDWPQRDRIKLWLHRGLILLIFIGFMVVIQVTAPQSIRLPILSIQIKSIILAVLYVSLLSIFPSLSSRLRSFRDKAQAFDNGLNVSQRLYRSVVLLFTALFILRWLGAGSMMPTFTWIFFSFCILVASHDALRWYRSISDHVLGKALLGLGFATASTLAYALARQEIAHVIRVTPTNIIHTTLLVAVLPIPVLIALAGGIVYLTCMLAALVIVPLSMMMRDVPTGVITWLTAGIVKTNTTKHPFITKLFQFFFYGTLGALVLRSGGNILNGYEAEIQKRLPDIIYQIDLYEGLECKLETGEKLSPLGDSKFLIGKKLENGHVEFLAPIKCDELPAR